MQRLFLAFEDPSVQIVQSSLHARVHTLSMQCCTHCAVVRKQYKQQQQQQTNKQTNKQKNSKLFLAFEYPSVQIVQTSLHATNQPEFNPFQCCVVHNV